MSRIITTIVNLIFLVGFFHFSWIKSHDVIYAEEEATGTHLLTEDLLNCLDRLEFSFLKWQECFAVLATAHYLKISRYINGKACTSSLLG